MPGPGSGQIPSSLNVATAIATNGEYVYVGSWAQTYNYNGDGTLNYEQVTSPDGVVYRRTYAYIAGVVSAITGWVKQ